VTPVLSSEEATALLGRARYHAPMFGTWCAAVLPTRASKTAIGCHTFRATGITYYLTNGGRIEVALRMADHSNAKTRGLYDRRNDDISVGEVGG